MPDRLSSEASNRIGATAGSSVFSPRYRFASWPNQDVPAIAAGVYAVWEGDQFIYAGMSGRELERALGESRKRYGLVTRLKSHAEGRLSGNQFCVYVANRLVIPSLSADEIARFASGELTLDQYTKRYIHSRFEYQFVTLASSQDAFALERRCRDGSVFGVKPLLNPL